MPAPLAAIGGTLVRGALMGGRTAMAGGLKEGIRGAARGAVKNAIGGKRGKIKSPLKEGESGTVKGVGDGGGSIISKGGALVPSINTSAIVPAAKSESVVAKKSSSDTGGGDASIISSLDNIKSLLEQIVSIEEEEQKNIKNKINSAAKEKERSSRDAEQSKQENAKVNKSRKKPENPIVKGAKKAVTGIWGLISGFVKDFILYKILDWFGDPKNKKNVQRIVEFFQGAVKFFGAVFNFIGGQLGRMLALIGPQLKIFGAFLQPLLDLLTLKWLTNPEEFLKNILNIPKILFETIPELFKALANFITFGLFENLGKWVGDIISNFNPLKLLGFGKEETEETSTTSEGETKQQKPPQEKKTDGGGGGVMSMLNPMNWFGGGDKQSVDTESLPKLKEGGIVSPPAGATGAAGVNGSDGSDGSSGSDGAKSLTQGSVTVNPLEKIVDVAGISANLTKAMKPFMDMMVAPFKIIGTAIVGLILKTVSKIPFVGNIIEPVIRMAASTFGVPSSVLTQLKVQTREDTEIKEIDKEKLLEKFSTSIKDVKESVKIAQESGGGNVFQSFFGGAGKIMGGIGSLLGNLFTSPASAATIPTPTVAPTTPPMKSFASHDDAGNAGVTQYSNTETGKSYQKNEDGTGWTEMTAPTPGNGMATFGETDGGSGRLVNAAGYVHGHFQTNTGTRQDVIKDTSQMVRAMLNTGLTDISIADGTTFMSSMSDSEISGLVERGLGLHGHSGDGRSVDIFVPKGTPVPFPLTDVKSAGGGEGRSGIVPGSGHTWVGHLTPDSQSGPSNVAANITQEPDTSGAIMLAPEQITKTKPTNSTGSQMQSVQQESLNLQSSNSNISSANPTVIDLGGGQDKSSVEYSTSSSQSLGATLPTSGLWAIFKTNL